MTEKAFGRFFGATAHDIFLMVLATPEKWEFAKEREDIKNMTLVDEDFFRYLNEADPLFLAWIYEKLDFLGFEWILEKCLLRMGVDV